jgi:hypothetical protein
MDEAQWDRSIRFAAFLIGAVLLLIFGAEFLVSGVVDWVVTCVANSFPGQCMGPEIWETLSGALAGAILVVLAILFFVLAYRARRPTFVAPTPPPPP